MTETAETPKPTTEEEVFKGLQQEFLQLCAQAGEKRYHIDNLTKDLRKIMIRLHKVDKKAQGMVQAQRLRQEAVQKASLKVVPPSPETTPAA